jgi:hypothetical protein
MEIRPIPSSRHVVEGHARAEGDGGQKAQLVARVDAAHVKLGVGLQVTQPIGLGEGLLIGQARVVHARQDVVAGAVHHAHDAGDRVARQPLGQGLDHRYTARHGGLEAQVDARGLGGFGQCLAVMGEHRLVGGDHVFAARDRGLGRGLGGAVLAAHELHEDVHIVAGWRAPRGRPPTRRH